MRKFIITAFLFILGVSIDANAQLTGTFNIPGVEYATIAAAVTDLNSVGVGAGGVTFNVASGHTESSAGPIQLTATGSIGNVITFQKSGAGVNPLITRTDAGTIATSNLGGRGDAVFTITGSDYVIFDGIDVTALDQGIEYGYYLIKVDGNDGCKFVTIKNCNITMNRGTSNFVAGIYSSNNVPTSPVSSPDGVTVTSIAGRSEDVTITGNTILNTQVGILLRGFDHASAPYNFYDQNFHIGMEGVGNGNVIENFGGNSALSYGIFMIFHNQIFIRNNSINNTASGGVPFASIAAYGIFTGTARGSTFTVNDNLVSLTGGGTAALLRPIRIDGAGSSVTLNNNTVTNCSYPSATSASFDAISVGSTAYTTIEVKNNTISGNSIHGIGTMTGINVTGIVSTNVEIANNEIFNNTKTGTHGTFNCVQAGRGNIELYGNEIYNNGFTNAVGSSAANLRGYSNDDSPPLENIYDNLIHTLYINGTNTNTLGVLAGIYPGLLLLRRKTFMEMLSEI